MNTSHRTTLIALAALAGLGAVTAAAVARSRQRAARTQRERFDYSDRRGFPLPAEEMRGAALADFEMPEDMRTPQALAGYSGA